MNAHKYRAKTTPAEAFRLSSSELRPIHRIAGDVGREWRKMAVDPNHPAHPYWRAMLCITTCHTVYGAEQGDSIVLYFLSNAQGFRGLIARSLKSELQTHLDTFNREIARARAESSNLAPPRSK